MRVHRTISLAALALLALPALVRAQTFEGTLKQRSMDIDDQALYDIVHPDGLSESDEGPAWLRATAARLFGMPEERLVELAMDRPEAVTVYIKGDKVRYDAGGGTWAIVDVASGVTTMVNPQGRYFIRISADAVKASAAESQRRADEMVKRMGLDPDEVKKASEAEEAAAAGPKPKVRALGKTETINGIKASAYEAMTDQEIAVGWCAEDTWGLRKTMERMAKQIGAMNGDDQEDDGDVVELQDAVCEGKLPVKVQVYRDNAMTAYSLEELLGIDRSPVPAAKFRIPAGYTEKKLSDLMR